MSGQRRNEARVLDGLLLLDKPTGITSNLAVQKVKRLFHAAKAGHTGSLDPLATGLLVVCFGRATKIANYLLSADKRYEVLLKLGVTTETGDTDGKVTARQDASFITDYAVSQGIKHLAGSIEQIPPMFSALKYRGTRLYKLARKGIEIERQPRKIQIYKLVLTKREGDLLHIYVHCSKGTYIRVLVEDLGRYLGCGAHVVNLRRTSIGPFVDPVQYTLPELEKRAQRSPSSLDEVLISPDDILAAEDRLREVV